MSSTKQILSNVTLRGYQRVIRNHDDDFIKKMPKVEMHVHIEGTLTPELRWSLAQRHGEPIPNPKTRKPCANLSELKGLYELLHDVEEGGVEGGMLRFFDLYYGGFEVLRDEKDFYSLAINYFQRAAEMNIRYCEPFFDPQGHTRRGVSFETVMNGFRRAQVEAAEKLNVARQVVHRQTNVE
jgi:adenosine deaminase